MRILIYGINYDPELTGIGKYTGQMARWLANSGHDVNVITAMPYYPEWKLNENYKGKLWHCEKKDGVKVYRVPLYVPAKISSSKRIVHEFSFLLSILPVWFYTLFKRKYDIVMYISPPFHLGIFPYLYSKLRGAKFTTHIQDLQVDAAQDLGMIKNETLLKWMFYTERFILQHSDTVSTISVGMKKRLVKKGIPESRISLLYNSVDTTKIMPLIKEQSLMKFFNLDTKDRVVLYSGNIGEKQGLEHLVEAAKRLLHRPEIKFVIVGSGAYKEKLMALAKDYGCHNVLFLPLQPYELLSELMAVADLHVVLQKQSASDLLMPSKLSTILAAGGCSIVSALPGTSLYEIVDQNNLGFLIKPECAESLCEAIENALSCDLQIYKLNARAFAENYLEAQNILAGFEKQLVHMVHPSFNKRIEIQTTSKLEGELN
ncbi:WcaI family glycosyltransferase [Dyadobacter sp. CY326]|uniref:WcaI family glycosyltransferase n=1 Tax=Dyadobacter sp. CY326 TaxID=2907300 RepID=UPI001F2EB8A0|nr:WcaI family glycosyltransferase [Dyadobacter sp. CY326]MCE7066140.1 WcaI family glycosyltransferase [Dyadobacter sp. CY326]